MNDDFHVETNTKWKWRLHWRISLSHTHTHNFFWGVCTLTNEWHIHNVQHKDTTIVCTMSINDWDTSWLGTHLVNYYLFKRKIEKQQQKTHIRSLSTTTTTVVRKTKLMLDKLSSPCGPAGGQWWMVSSHLGYPSDRGTQSNTMLWHTAAVAGGGCDLNFEQRIWRRRGRNEICVNNNLRVQTHTSEKERERGTPTTVLHTVPSEFDRVVFVRSSKYNYQSWTEFACLPWVMRQAL